MQMTATSTFHTSETRTVREGQQFEVGDQLGRDLEKRGLATPLGEAKAEPAPENKAEAAPANKAAKRAPKTKDEE